MGVRQIAQSIDKFQSIFQYPAVIDLFGLLFEKAGIRVVDTGEEFSCYHRGTHIDFEERFDESSVDYVVELNTTQVDHLIELASDRKIDDVRRYRILRTLFAPAIGASVNPFHCLKRITVSNPLLSNQLFRRLLRMEDLIHVYIRSPIKDEPEIGHTLVFEKKEWLVSPGLHGEPGRVFRLTVDDALEFHKHVFSALKIDSSRGWIVFARWYLKWRNRVSERQE